MMSSSILPVLVVIATLPGVVPSWMRIEQGVCGLVLIAVVTVLYGKRLRAVFAK
jgi:hypothetical protein